MDKHFTLIWQGEVLHVVWWTCAPDGKLLVCCLGSHCRPLKWLWFKWSAFSYHRRPVSWAFCPLELRAPSSCSSFFTVFKLKLFFHPCTTICDVWYLFGETWTCAFILLCTVADDHVEFTLLATQCQLPPVNPNSSLHVFACWCSKWIQTIVLKKK